MKYKVEQPITLIAIFLWIGFVCAISCMEAWLKFRAPGVTLPIGLGIGRLVFAALNKVEWFFALIILIQTLKKPSVNSLFFLGFAILILQTVWLLPALDTRALNIINGNQVGDSKDHLYYATAEVIKIVLLFVFGLRLLKPNN